MNIFIQEMKMSFKTSVLWLFGILLFIGLYIAMFPTLGKEAGLLKGILDKFPEAFVRALGLGNFDMSNILGYYGFMSIYIFLIVSIFAMKIGMGIISEEIRVKASDFLLSKPVSRFEVLSGKALCAFVNITVVSILFSGTAYIMCRIISNTRFDDRSFILISLSFFLVQLFFVTFGMMMGAFFKKVKTVLPPVMGIVFGFYAVQFLSQSFPDSYLSYFTPFAYFNIQKILSSRALDMNYLLLDIGLSVVFTALAYAKYIKKDMPSV